jgi:PAS domain S-box-containing protein
MMRPVGEVPCVHPEDEVDELEGLFREYPDWSSIPVVSDGRLLGVVPREWVPRVPTSDRRRSVSPIPLDQVYRYVLDSLNTGLIIIDGTGLTRALNPAGAEILGVQPEAVVDKPYEELAQHLFVHMREYLRHSAVPLALSGSVDRGERELTLPNGRNVLFKFAAMKDDLGVSAVVVTFMDVTPLKLAQKAALRQQREIDMAFGLTLPNSKVEAKLKSSPEYQDIYDPQTGQARVTAVIADGTYRHVVNGLRIMAELKALGVFDLVGIDKDTMVKAFIFHDIGKAQPELAVGQVFVPQETFEPGVLHAERSADWARKDYQVSPDVEWLVRLHHTREQDWPSDFPAALKPMLRLFQLVDGLSAGMTRRLADVSMSFQNGVLTVRESNSDRRYDRIQELDLYTGRTVVRARDAS